MYVEQILDVCYADGNGRCYNGKDEELGYWRIGEARGKHVAVGLWNDPGCSGIDLGRGSTEVRGRDVVALRTLRKQVKP